MYFESYAAITLLAVLLLGAIIRHSMSETLRRRKVRRSLRIIRNWY